MAFGVGLGLANHKGQVQEAKAATSETTIYIDWSGATHWTTYNNNPSNVQVKLWVGSEGTNNCYIWDDGSTDGDGNMGTMSSYRYFTRNDRDYTYTGGKVYCWNDGGDACNKSSSFSFGSAEPGQNLLIVTGGTSSTGPTVSWGTLDLSTKYSVTWHLDDKGDTSYKTEDILEDSLPSLRGLNYGEVFSGWYDNSSYTGSPLEGITSDIEIWGKIENAPTITYSFDKSRVSSDFASVYFYAWDSNGAKAAWSATPLASSTFTVSTTEGSKFILHNNSGNQTVDITPSGVANDVVNILNSKSGGHYNIGWESNKVDDGYYISGVGGDWDLAHATKMTFNNDYSPLDTDGNIAVYYGLSLTAGDEIKVRKFTDFAEDWYNNNDTGDNYVCSSTGSYDIFFKNDVFYVSTHVQRYTVTVTNVFFNGATKDTTSAGVNQLATQGQTFNPSLPEISGYVARRAYTDANCTTPYTPAQPTQDFQIYIKYTKVGYYLVGDETFSGTDFSVDGGILMGTGAGNKAVLEGVSIPKDAKVKIFNYKAETTSADWYGHLGSEYTFASNDLDENIVFSKGGSYSFYLNNEDDVYISAGLNSFLTSYLTKIGGVCKTDNTTDVDSLATIWGQLASDYADLLPSERSDLTNAQANKDGTNLQKVASSYDWIVGRYGALLGVNYNFMSRTVVPHSRVIVSQTTINSTNTALVIITISSVCALALGGYFFFRKRKEDR